MPCANLYHLYSLKNVRITHGGKILLVKLHTLKSQSSMFVFHVFQTKEMAQNCTKHHIWFFFFFFAIANTSSSLTVWWVQKQPPRCSVKKGDFRNFIKFTGKHLCQSLFFNKIAGLRPNSTWQISFAHKKQQLTVNVFAQLLTLVMEVDVSSFTALLNTPIYWYFLMKKQYNLLEILMKIYIPEG